MFKKLLFVIAIGAGVLYGAGVDFASLKRSITNAADRNASSTMGNVNDNGGWGRN